MSYAIVGFGAVGQALARAFARKNIKVAVASRRPPEAGSIRLTVASQKPSNSRFSFQ